MHVEPGAGLGTFERPGVSRRFCATCGSPLTATFDYLPGQVYVPLGVLDRAGEFPPRRHAHAASRLTWLHIADDLPREAGSARARLNAPREVPEACG